MDFDAGDVVGKTLYCGGNYRLHMIVKPLMAFDCLVGVDNNLHKLTPGCSKNHPAAVTVCIAAPWGALPRLVLHCAHNFILHRCGNFPLFKRNSALR
jgi:hypothetical protein